MTRAPFMVIALAASVAVAPGVLNAQTRGAVPRPANAPAQTPVFPGQTDAPEQKLGVAFDVVTVLEGLRNPWGMTFLPSGKMLVKAK